MYGFHHLRRRVQVSQGLEPFPARILWKRALDYVMYGIGLIAPLALLPQILELYRAKSAAGLSLLTWTLLACVNVAWVTYAVAHKDRQLLVANILMFFCNLSIVLGIVLY